MSFKPNKAGFAQLYEAIGYGLLNAALAVETEAKRNAPVLTGNLRRSIHSAAFVQGRRIYGATDDNGRAIPDYAAEGIHAVVGTNCGYGVFLELGTVRMAAQPYLLPAFASIRGSFGPLIKAGMERHAPGSFFA